MAGAAPAVKLEDEVLRKFYRSFHKHGSASWAKVAKDTKMTIEQCEMLHKQHMSFLGLPASLALETAFLALVNDHYNATQKHLKDEMQEDEAVRGGRRGTGELEEPEAHVATSSSQKPRRTPKPTPQRLAAEEEQQARRQAKSNQGTPKSAKAKVLKAPPSPPAGEWTSSQRKRSRRLFEDNAEQEPPRYRSPIIDRWRGRHTTDVDEGVDALLSLASGAHASNNIDDGPVAAEIATTTADADVDAQEVDHLQGTPKRTRGGRGGRSTPTPTGTPVKGVARPSSAAAAPAASADVIPAPSSTGLRSPRARGAASSAAAAAAATTTSGRGGTASAGRPRKDQLGSPTSSVQRVGGAGAVSAPGTADLSDVGVGAPSTSEAATGAPTAGPIEAPGSGGGGTPTGAGTAAGRPVRKRKPSAIAIAAAAAADDDDAGGSRGARGVVAAMAAAVAAAGASLPDAMASMPMPEALATSLLGDVSGSGQATDIMSNTAALLASVPPVRTRGSARSANNGPVSRRASERPSPLAPVPPADAVAQEAAQNEAGTADAEFEALSGEAAVRAPSVEAPGPATGRGRTNATVGQSQTSVQGSVPGLRLGPLRGIAQPLPGRSRRRKPLPERLPPMWEPLKITPSQPGDGSVAAATEVAIPDADAAVAASTGPGQPATSGEGGAPMPAAELALRHCLGPRVRRWCMYEFLYSALDRPWFHRNELLEFCVHMQLPTTKLTRLEWSVLRGALGRPRRLSLAFLREERLRLEGYRERARVAYEEFTDRGMEVPPELPRQLRVGQEVTARHTVSRQMHDGVILTVKGSKYRVQFHRGDLMTEMIRDTDVMPLDPHECTPLQMPIVPSLLNGRPYDPVRLASLRGLPPGLAGRPLGVGMRPLGSWATGLDTQMMREQDAAMVAEVEHALEVKERLVARLTQLNNEAASGLHTDENGGRTENFQLQYTKVVLQLKETNAVLEAALNRLQGRQQQVMSGPNSSFGAVLALQHPQMAAAAAGAAAAVASSGARVGGLTPGMPGAPLSQFQALPQGQAQTPPQPVSQQSGPAAASSPTAAAAQSRAAAGRASVPLSPSAPLVVPPQRASAASAAAPPGQSFAMPSQGMALSLLMPVASPEQLVEHALAEARTVVDACRGKVAEPVPAQPMLMPPGPQPVPVVAPMIAMQMQAPGGMSVPLILPPGPALQQLSLQQSAGAEGQVPEQPSCLASTHLPHPADSDCGGNETFTDGLGVGLGDASAGPSSEPIRVKTEEGGPIERPGTEALWAHGRVPAEVQASTERPGTEEELAEGWLRDVIVGCVGVLFTIQKCTAGNVPAATVAEALDLAVQQLQIKTDGENDKLYRDIVQSVQGLKGHLTRALV